MPKKRPRESSEDIIERYQRKIRRIEERQRKKHRRVRFISSSDSEETTPVIVTPTTPLPPPTPPSAEEIPAQTNSMAMPVEVIGSDDVISPPCPPTPEDPNCPATDPELDPDLLLALGEEISNIPNFGEKIHHSLAQRWDPILKKGLPKEAKDKLFKDYLVPENCTLLQAPRLNNEVAAAISEAARHRDKRKEIDQQQLGVGISAINKALTLMLTGDDKLEAIRILSDGCRILTDLHNQQTQARINVINYALAKPFLNVVQDSERDDTLYGNKLGEKIKASKAIEKQGLSIKKFTKVPKTTPSLEQAGTSTRPYQYPAQPAVASYQGNWSGPPRFQQNRGGRRGPRRMSAPPNRRLPPPAPSAVAPNKPRAVASRR